MKKLLFTTILIFVPVFFSVSFGENQVIDEEIIQVEIIHTEKKSDVETFVKQVAHWYKKNMNYGTIVFLMALESSFLPIIPSEAVISPAAYAASKPDSDLNFFLVIFFATLGTLIGALIIYGLSSWLGRKALYKFADSRLGSALMLDSDKIKQAEDLFKRRSKTSIFIAQLIPGVRYLIPVPAGLAKMNLLHFIFFMFIGASIYNTFMALLGYFLHKQTNLIHKHSYEVSIAIVCIVILVIFVFVVRYFMLRSKKEKKYGLIGFPLTHSFSKKYFTKKFKRESINAKYSLFEIKNLDEIENFIKNEKLQGLNVTIPYKEQITTYVDELDKTAQEVGAVNVLKITHEKDRVHLHGYNTDVIGFEKSIAPHLKSYHKKALLLGSGGTSKAVEYVFRKLGIEITRVSRTEKSGFITYQSLDKETIEKNLIIVNTTPLGTFPNTNTYPEIPYQYLTEKHLLFDVVYNPTETIFLKKGKEHGATTINGEQMLMEQAEAAWEIWNK